jgi:hypothetical protein
VEEFSEEPILETFEAHLPSAEKALRSMLDRAAKFNLDKVNQQDLVGVYAGDPDV